MAISAEAQKRLISQGTHDEMVTLCGIYQNQVKGERSRKKRSNTEKYSIFLVFLQILHVNFRFSTDVYTQGLTCRSLGSRP